MFKIFGNDRLAEWRDFRLSLETSPRPLSDLAVFWANAPFVNSYINPYDIKSWPDPWHLVLDDMYDNLGVALGMLYTLKLTQRFTDTFCEIHKSALEGESEPYFILIVDNEYVLNFVYRECTTKDKLPSNAVSQLLWSGTVLP